MENAFSPLVSIITPTFNHERYIGPCIESVLKQTYQNWEQIVIDDGSTDRTAEIAHGFADPRIRYVHQENAGIEALAHTYNRALGLCTGELIAVLEGDDMWPAQKLAMLVPAFVDQDVVLAYGETADVNTGGTVQGRLSQSNRLRRALPVSVLFNNPVGSATHYMLFSEGTALVGPSTVVIRRLALEHIGGFQFVEGLPLTDYPTFLELSLSGRFHYVAEVMGYRRRHLKSVTVFHAGRIGERVAKFPLEFLEKQSGRISLTPVQLKRVEHSWQKARFKLSFSEGRFLLTQKRWTEARVQFKSTLRSDSVSVRLAGIIGYIFSWLRLDIEPLMRMCGRADLREPETVCTTST
jgi:glycosyltransferase involved in cell wall biosynthesis